MKRRLLNCLLFFMAILSVTNVVAQERTITGVVVAKDDGLPIPGASITLKGTSRGVQTNPQGRYTIAIPSTGKEVLVFTYLGYAPREITVTSRNLDVTLEPSANNLDEVVVAAGGVKRTAREQGYATTRIDSETLTAGKSPTIAGGLTGKVPGLQINATSTGVNPNYRLVLRGDRSITGNNQALIVLDGAVVPNELLGNINPDDVDDIQILNGSSGAALYGSEASNGVLIITTKKGKIGAPIIKVSNTTSIEKISFYPEIQNRFGSGTDDYPVAYEPIENQQYGPEFDGTSRPVGRPTEDGRMQYVDYSPRNDKYDFWDVGISSQTDFSLSSGDDRSSSYLSAQYVKGKGTTPKDVFERISFRFNGERSFSKRFSAKYNVSLTQNKYDITTQTSAIYEYMLNTPAQIPLLSYTDWQNPDSWANPNNYYNDYYENPYWVIDGYRQKTKNDYLTGLLELNYKASDWLNFIYRASLSNRYYENKSKSRGFEYNPYALATSAKTNAGSSVSDNLFQNSNFSTDFIANMKKDVNDFSINVLLAASLRSFTSNDLSASGSGLQVPELYNLSNITGTPSASESWSNRRQYGVWADATFGYKKFLFAHVTARQDWDSRLAPANRTFFYPALDVSFIPTDAFDFLKGSKVIDYIKIRGGISKVGNVNVGTYALLPNFGSQTGYGYGTGFTPGSSMVSNDLKPEITKGIEFGADFKLFKGKVDATVTYYKSNSTGQAISAGVANTTGYSTYLLNAGELQNKGIESRLAITPINNNKWRLTVGANYTNNKNELLSLTQDLTRIGVSGSGTIYGDVFVKTYPIMYGSDYIRDEQGRVIVDRLTGYPQGTTTGNLLGNVQPRHRLGTDFSVSYKGLTFSGLFEYRAGFVQLSSAASTFEFSGSSIRSTYYNRQRFVFPNSSYLDPATNSYVENTNVTVSSGNSGFWSSSARWSGVTSNSVYSGNYWKLRELALSYKVPSAALKSVKFVKTATISAQGRNLFFWVPKSNTWGDPDVSSNGSGSNAVGITSLAQTPPTRYFGGTLSLTF